MEAITFKIGDIVNVNTLMKAEWDMYFDPNPEYDRSFLVDHYKRGYDVELVEKCDNGSWNCKFIWNNEPLNNVPESSFNSVNGKWIKEVLELDY